MISNLSSNQEPSIPLNSDELNQGVAAGEPRDSTSRRQSSQPHIHHDGPRPRIVHLLDGSSVTGAETLANLMMLRMHKRYRFASICIGNPGSLLTSLRKSGFPVYIARRKSGVDWLCSRRLATLISKEKADIIHAHQGSAMVYAMLSRLLYQRPSILYTEHERPYPDLPSPRRAVINKLLFEGRDRGVAASRSVRQALILNDGFRSDQIGVVYNGVGIPTPCSPTEVQSVRQHLGIRSEDLLIFQGDYFSVANQHRIAIQAMEQVARVLPQARLIMVGEGPELQSIQNLVVHCNLESNVQFLQSRLNVEHVLQASDIVLSTCSGGGESSSVLQGLARGLPVVAVRVGAIAEVVEDRVSGLLACPGDYAGLAEIIVMLGKNLHLRHEIGAQGLKRATTLFSDTETIANYSNLYDSMIS